jgi:dihydroorotase
MKRTWIYNATIVNEGLKFAGSVVVEDDTICEVLQGEVRPSVPCDAEIDARGCYLIPGVIDDHVHFRDPGLTIRLMTQKGCLLKIKKICLLLLLLLLLLLC